MGKIVGIGANVYDTLITLKAFPSEDTKVRAESIVQSGGGPCATALVTASRLGADTAYIGYIADDEAGMFLKQDFERYGVLLDYVDVLKGYRSFCSYIWLSKATASRTCTAHPGNLPGLVLDENKLNAIKNAGLLLVDGNHLDAAAFAAKTAKAAGVKVLYDAGGLYDGVEKLLSLTDILIPSKRFSLWHTGCTTVEEAAEELYKRYNPEIIIITEGESGGIIYNGEELKRYPAFGVDAVDTNGAGDVFHGAFAYCMTLGWDYYKAAVFSSAVSAIKCTKLGSRKSVPTYDEVIKFLNKEQLN